MCNACGFQCCGCDAMARWGCDHCDEPACWAVCNRCGEFEQDCCCDDGSYYEPPEGSDT